MEEQDLDMISGDNITESSQESMIADDHEYHHLPAYLSYLSLVFKIISTVIVMLMAGWVIITIKTTTSLHKTHNIYVAYLLATDALFAFTSTVLSGALMIGYLTGTGDFIGCNVLIFMLYPMGIIFYTFLVMSIDKVIAITFPFKHREIMKPQVVCGIIVVKYILAVAIYARYLFIPDGFTKVAQFSICILNDSMDDGRLENFIILIIPNLSSCIITVSLDIYLTIKAYQIRKKIQEESKLSGGHSGDNNQLKALKKKQANIEKHLKPMMTLLVVVMGNSFIGMLLLILIIYATLLESPTVYDSVVQHVIIPNIGYVAFILHPFAYGLYFKQIRKPMINLLKRVTCPCKCKSAAVAPLPQRNRITWMS